MGYINKGNKNPCPCETHILIEYRKWPIYCISKKTSIWGIILICKYYTNIVSFYNPQEISWRNAFSQLSFIYIWVSLYKFWPYLIIKNINNLHGHVFNLLTNLYILFLFCLFKSLLALKTGSLLDSELWEAKTG